MKKSNQFSRASAGRVDEGYEFTEAIGGTPKAVRAQGLESIGGKNNLSVAEPVLRPGRMEGEIPSLESGVAQTASGDSTNTSLSAATQSLKPKRRLERNAEHQKYRVSDGSLVPGGSTTSKYGDSPEPLIIWANREGLKGNDIRTIRNKSANSGTCAHFLIECYFRNEEADLREFEDKVITSAQNSFNKFLQFWEREQLTLVDTEIQLVSETYRYGGTLDAVARDEFGNLVLLDWKSSKKDIYFSQRAQIAAYEGLWIERKQMEVGKITRRAIVRIPSSDDGTCEAHWIPDEKQERYIKIARAQAHLFNVIKANK